MSLTGRIVERAKRLRANLSPPEARLWLALRRRPGGLKFRRQHPIGRFVIDFFCHEASLAIEVDGASHDFVERAIRDERRDVQLALLGVTTLRIPAEDVRLNLDGVVEHILATARQRIGE